MRIFREDLGGEGAPATPATAQRWASSPERKSAAKLVLPFLVLGSLAAAGAALVYLGHERNVLAGAGLSVLGLLSFALSAFVYTAARARFNEKQETAARQGVNDVLAKLEDGLDLGILMKLNRKQMEAYHLLTRQQASDAYKKSVMAMGTGLLALIAGVLAVIFLPGTDTIEKITTGVLTAVGTVLAGYISRTYLRTYDTALHQLNHYFEQPLQTSYLLAAERLIGCMTEAKRDKLYTQVIEHILRATSNNGQPPTSPVKPAANGNGAGKPGLPRRSAKARAQAEQAA